jgi:prepilin-type N-terminal cleavage/methylation domain-containing protein
MKHTHYNKGFTLIEVMVASGLFVVIMIVAIGVLLSVNKSHKTQDAVRTAIDNVSFVMEDMTRNLRLSTAIACPAGSGTATLSCLPDSLTDGKMARLSLEFEGLEGDSTDTGDNIVYWIVDGPEPGATDGYIVKSTTGYHASETDENYKRITPAEVAIDTQRSGFTVSGAETLDGKQPRIIIRLYGTVTYQSTVVPFNIQTTVSSRNIDS